MNATTTLDLSGLDRLTARLRRLQRLDATPLMVSWMKTLDDGNRRGIMAGLDGKGNLMPRVTYRPKPSALRVTAAQQNNPKPGQRRGEHAGYGNHPAGQNNNLTSAEYRRLAGPALAPRGMFSRVITNFKTDYAQLPSGNWQVTYWWDDVVSAKGVSFLRFHFDGKGRLPRRDLRGIRPVDAAKCQSSGRAWMVSEVRSSA